MGVCLHNVENNQRFGSWSLNLDFFPSSKEVFVRCGIAILRESYDMPDVIVDRGKPCLKMLAITCWKLSQ